MQVATKALPVLRAPPGQPGLQARKGLRGLKAKRVRRATKGIKATKEPRATKASRGRTSLQRQQLQSEGNRHEKPAADIGTSDGFPVSSTTMVR